MDGEVSIGGRSFGQSAERKMCNKIKVGLFTVIIFCVSLLFTHTESNNVVSIKLRRVKSGLEQLLEAGTDLRKLSYLYGYGGNKAKVKPQNTTVPLFKFLDYEYYGEVLIGHPGQKFKAVFDTTWAYSWVTSKRCSSFSIPCMLRNKYDHDTSSTYIENRTKFNNSLGLKGFFSTDLFHIGQLNVTNQTFIEMTALPMLYMLSHADAIVGLGFPEASPLAVPVFVNLVRQRSIAKPVFSIYLNRDRTSPKGGSITLGAVDTGHIARNTTVTFLKITKKFYWEFQMDRIVVRKGIKERVLCKTGCYAFPDTSVNSISGPPDDIEYINEAIGAEEFFFGRFRIPCDHIEKSPFIKFSLGGKNFTLKGADYVQQMSYGGVMVCLSAFVANSMPPSYQDRWILGGAFLSRFFTQYDFNSLGQYRIGFAPLNNNLTDYDY